MSNLNNPPREASGSANTASLLSSFSANGYPSGHRGEIPAPQQQQPQPPANYYASSTSNIRESDTATAKKMAGLNLMSHANSLANNLFAYSGMNDKSGLSSPQDGLSVDSSRSPSNVGVVVDDKKSASTLHNPLFTLANTVQSDSDQQQEHQVAATAAAAIQWGKLPDFTGSAPSSASTDSQLQAFHLAASSKDDSDAPKKYACTFPDCDKSFSRRMNLKSHMQSSHEHKKPFQCSVCLKTFARHSDRRRHENNQHKTTAGFVCGGVLKNGQHWGCSKVFKRKDGLMAHWRSQKARKKCLKNIPIDDTQLQM